VRVSESGRCTVISRNAPIQVVAALGRGGHDKQPDHLREMVGLLVDGLRYGQPVP
jgi:hypothetical protein